MLLRFFFYCFMFVFFKILQPVQTQTSNQFKSLQSQEQLLSSWVLPCPDLLQVNTGAHCSAPPPRSAALWAKPFSARRRKPKLSPLWPHCLWPTSTLEKGTWPRVSRLVNPSFNEVCLFTLSVWVRWEDQYQSPVNPWLRHFEQNLPGSRGAWPKKELGNIIPCETTTCCFYT